MSDQELQATAVRMLHDPEFLALVYAEPTRALAGLDLDAAERAQLTRFDRRAWKVDPHRRTRVLRALLDEYFGTVATLWRSPQATSEASRAFDAFFSSPRFHAAIRAGESLVRVFGEHLAAQALSPLGRALLALERAIAQVRRAPAEGAVSASALRVRAPRAATLALPMGTLAAWEALAQDLRRRGDPIDVMLTGQGGGGYRPPLMALTAAPKAAGSGADQAGAPIEYVLVERPRVGPPSPVAAFVGEGMHALLAGLETATPREVITRRLMDEGLEAAEADELLAELEADGLILPA